MGVRQGLVYIAAVVVTVASLGVAACGNTTGAGATPSATPDSVASAPRSDAGAAGPAVVLLPDGLAPARVRVSLARTEAQQQRGLMYVQNLPVDDGMLFLFDIEKVQGFWMKNTLIPLDMIFIRSDMTVVGIVANAKPLSLETLSVGQPSRFVLEVNGGWSAQHGVTAGTKVQFDNVSP